MILKNLPFNFVACLLLLFQAEYVKAQRVLVKTSFNRRPTLEESHWQWQVKNNTSPRTYGKYQGWRFEGNQVGWLGEPFDASSIRQTLAAGIDIGSIFVPTERTFGHYSYAVVGYEEGDYDNAHISKWLLSKVIRTIKNGDEIKFRLKEQAGICLGQGNNTLEVRLSIGDDSDSKPANVGDTATSVGTFTTLLLTVKPSDFKTEWTEYTATVRGLPPGKVYSGRIGFRYHFEHGGYNNCRDRRDLPPELEVAIDVAKNFNTVLGGVGDDFIMAYDLIRGFSTLARGAQKGKNGTFIGLDDFRYISNSETYVIDRNDNVWHDKIAPLVRPRLSYEGSPDCGPKGAEDFFFMNNSGIARTIHVSADTSVFIVLLGNVPANQNIVTVQPWSQQYINLKLKPGLSPSSPYNRDLVIRANSSGGAILHEVKVLVDVKPAPKPIAGCSQWRRAVTLDQSGVYIQRNAEDFSVGSSAGESCPGPLNFSFQKTPFSPFTDSLRFTCTDVGMKTANLVVTNTKTRSWSTCPIYFEVKAPVVEVNRNSRPYYLPNQTQNGLFPMDSILPPVYASPCGYTTSIGSVFYSQVSGEPGLDYTSKVGLPPNSYQITWNVQPSGDNVPPFQTTVDISVRDTTPPVAVCKDTVKIGFNRVNILTPNYFGFRTSFGKQFKLRDDISAFRDVNNGSYDNSGVRFTPRRGITKYGIWSPFYLPVDTFYLDSFEISCNNIGQSYPVVLEVADWFNNTATCRSYVQIVSADKPECKDVTIAINPTTGINNLTTSDVLVNGVSGVCGLQNVVLSKSRFTCADINKTIPVTVGYTDPNKVVRGCTSNVTVKSYSIPEETCSDSVKVYLTNTSQYQESLKPLVLSACGPQQPWSLTIGNLHFPSLVGDKAWNFEPGVTEVIRRAIVANDTFTCQTSYVIYDTVPPVLTATPSNVSQTIVSLPNFCKYVVEIPNPFQQGTYREWGYELTGATTKKVLIKNSDEFGRYINGIRVVRNEGWPAFWLNQGDSINPGVTTVTISARDYSGGRTTVSYTITLNVLNPSNPSVGYFGAQMPTVRGNFCGATYNHYIESPMSVPCNQTDYMWYYQVRDGFMGNILFEQDSIHQNNGAFIPLRVSPYLNQSISNTIHFGYHDKTSGNKIYSSNSSIFVVDTLNPIVVPRNQTIQNTNDSTFTFLYSIPSPLSPIQRCSGARWGYKITGATTLSSTPNASISYTPNQLVEFGFTDYSQWYPSIPADSSPQVLLNNGVNTIEYVLLEESGVSSAWTNVSYKYDVNIQDVSVPSLSCPSNDTLYRSAGPCYVSVANPVAQFNGFTGPFGKSRLFAWGQNNRVKLNKSTAPDSITFTSNSGGSVLALPSYTTITFNSSGTVSFDWTYQCATPQFFRPFATTNRVNRLEINPTLLPGFNQSSSAVQSGTFTKVVQAGDVLRIGVYEGGGVQGYFRISNFSAPYKTPSPVITQPVFSDNAAYYFQSNIDTVYPIGNSLITFTLTNMVNGATTTCSKRIVVIDSFARSLNCQNQTVYLGPQGFTELKATTVLPTSCFPISSTYLSKDTFTGADIGTQSVLVTSIGSLNDTLTCNFNVTVLDTTKPTQQLWQLVLPLSPAGTATLTDSLVKTFFVDNHKIVSVTKAKTNFTCDDIGMNTVVLSATDSSGNVATIPAQIQVTPGFAPLTSSITTYNVCSNEDVNLQFETDLGYSLNYQWQEMDSVKHWNYYTSSRTNALLNGTLLHQFFRFKNETYVAYRSSDNQRLTFAKLDTISNNWRPALSDLQVPLINSYKVYVNPASHPSFEELRVAYRDPATSKFKIQLYRQDTTWFTYEDLGGYTQSGTGGLTGPIDYFTYLTDGPGVFTATATDNVNITNMFGNEGLFFPIRNNGTFNVFCVSMDTSSASGYPRSYFQLMDTIKQDVNGNYLIRKRFDLSSNHSQIEFVVNGKKIVGVRNANANQNRFFEMIRGTNGFVRNRDSLSTDPTGGSALFDIESLGSDDYIAYKSTNGKVCVKKYTGSNTWSTVGSLDFSDEQVKKVALTSVNNQLYLTYLEVTGRVVVKQLNGNLWIDLGSPNTNIPITVANNDDPCEVVNINNEPALYYYDNLGGYRLLRRDLWKRIPGATASTYTPDVSVAGLHEYRCIASSSCINAASEIKRVNTTPTPQISAVSAQQNVLAGGTAQIQVNTTGATTNWKYNFDAGSAVLTTGSTLVLPDVEKDTAVYAYSYNGNCYSDTVSVNIFPFDSSVSIYNVIVKDSICVSDYVQASLDTSVIGYKYSLFKRDTNGVFVDQNYAINKVAEWQDVVYTLTPTQKEEYRIKVEKSVKDALQLQTGDIYYNHINFGETTLPITNELTVEAWVAGITTNPNSVLGIKAHNSGFWDPNSTKNWAWNGSTFDVYNGDQKRSLAFPNLPASNTWTHVATTAGPNGMNIYYDGVLVASDTISAAVNFNQIQSALLLGIKESGANTSSAYGMDEFRIWNTVRTDSEIAAYKDQCLTGSETGLILYNNFSDYNSTTKKFTSLKGNDGEFRIFNSGEVLTTIERNNTCLTNQPPAYFLTPFTVNVVSQPAITFHTDFVTLPDTVCNGAMVTLEAIPSSGTVTWYNAFTGGDAVAVGNTINVFVNADTAFYPTVTNTVCQRKETLIEAVQKPAIYFVEYDRFCAGSNVGYFYVDYRGDGYRIYEDSIGGLPLDIDSVRNDIIFLEPDTFWLDAYNQPDDITCVTLTRTRVIFKPIPKPQIVSTFDSTVVGSGSVTLKALATNSNDIVQWFDLNGTFLNVWDTVYTTPILNTTTSYQVRTSDQYGACDWSPWDTVTAVVVPYKTRQDTVIACESYTWENGITYTQSNATISYIKPNGVGSDSLIQLHLTIIPFENTQVSVNKNSMCVNDSATITVVAAQNGYEYLLINAATHAIVQGPVTGNGSDILFNTGPLTQNVSYNILATDTVSVNNRSFGCAKQIGNVINLRVGTLLSSTELVACGSYVWRNKNITQSGFYYDTLASTQGCDSVLELQMTINPISERIDSVIACKSYVWNGITYSSSTSTPTRFLGINALGCDSVVRLHLTINRDSTIDHKRAWDTYTWTNGVTYTTSNNTATRTLTTASGCDSVVTLNLTILNSAARTVLNPQTICAGRSYTINNNVYTTAGTYYDTLYAGTGNDSIYVTQLTVNAKPVTSSISGQAYPLPGSTHAYSVTSTFGSSYYWIIENGVQLSGGNSNAITIQWNAAVVNSSVKVVEVSSLGCFGDTVSQSVVLPVHLLHFDAQKKAKTVRLNWTTTSELNNKGFDVERSFDGMQFQPIGFVEGKGTTNQTSNYVFVDAEALQQNSPSTPTTVYYRLKQIDFSGRFDYSRVVRILNQPSDEATLNIKAVPNPFQNELGLIIASNQDAEATVKIVDANGKEIRTLSVRLAIGETFLDLEQVTEWKAGLYFVLLSVGEEQRTLRVFKKD